MTWICCGTAGWARCSAASGRRPRWARTCAVIRGGNVVQLGKTRRKFLTALAQRAPLLPGAGTLAFIDIDSMQKRVYGHKKQILVAYSLAMRRGWARGGRGGWSGPVERVSVPVGVQPEEVEGDGHEGMAGAGF